MAVELVSRGCRGIGATIPCAFGSVEAARRSEIFMSDVSIKEALAGAPGEGSGVTIKGWVRTRRDSKGGFSFITVNDGSCFDSIQVVAPNTLANYASDV